MDKPEVKMNELAQRVGKGDLSATAELRRQFEQQLAPMVRQTMRAGGGSSPIARRVLAEVRQVTARGWRADPAEDRVVTHIVRRISDSMIDRLRPRSLEGWKVRDTVRN
jgi:hypothetical protein